jgi:hypothetical protein
VAADASGSIHRAQLRRITVRNDGTGFHEGIPSDPTTAARETNFRPPPAAGFADSRSSKALRASATR